MSQALLIILGVYLFACYAYGVLLLVRLGTQRMITRPTSRLEPTELVRAAKQELEQGEFGDEQRVAA